MCFYLLKARFQKGAIMMNADILETFKKHLGKAGEIENTQQTRTYFHSLDKTSKIKQFGEDMKSANEFIGAIQMLDFIIKKLIEQAQGMSIVDKMKGMGVEEVRDCDFEVFKTIVLKELLETMEKCVFMGTNLFDATLCMHWKSEEFSIEVPNPMPLFENEQYKDFILYLEDKSLELRQCLTLISAKISSQDIFDSKNSNHNRQSIVSSQAQWSKTEQ